MSSRILFGILAVFVSVVFCSTDECGRVKAGSDGSFPWNVGIYSANHIQAELICLGSVIQSNAVLTAAHCFCDNISGGLRNKTFYILTDNLPKTIDLRSAPQTLQKINKNNIHIHKYYQGFTNFLQNDLAIIKDKFRFTDKTKPVCVDWSGDIRDNNSQGKQPIWHANKVTISDQTYLETDDCHDASRAFISFITADKFCAKLKTSGIPLTHASEGAGLVFTNSNRWYIKGVISMHDVTNNQFSTYSTISQYINWISNIIASE